MLNNVQYKYFRKNMTNVLRDNINFFKTCGIIGDFFYCENAIITQYVASNSVNFTTNLAIPKNAYSIFICTDTSTV